MNVPKLRFKDFDGEWKPKKLENFIQFFSGLTYSPDDVLNSGGTLVLRSSNIQSGSIVNADNVYVKSEVVNSENVLKGDIVVVVRNGSRNLIGKHAQVKEDMPNTVIGAFMTGLRSDEPNFLNILLDTKQFQKEIHKNLGATINQITTGAFKGMSFVISDSIGEQKKIGSFFSTIDKKIQLQQEKIDLLQKQKKAFLQKMFPKVGKKLPELRFDGFTGDWETNKLRHYLVTSKEKNINEFYTKLDVLSVSGDYGIVNQIEFQGRSFAGVSVAPYGVVEKGDIVYTKSPLKSNPYGIIKANKGKTGIVSTLYAIYKVKNNADAEFIEYYFANDLRLNKYLKPLVNKGAKNDMKVSDDNALIGYVVFPKSLEEQKKIAEFFNKFDDVINKQHKKLELLQKQKQFFIQQMFI